MTLITKAGSRIADSYEFVLSTEAPDRTGDIVLMSGLDTKAFEANPIALYMHNHAEPIGIWSNIKKAAGAMTGRLHVASKGTSKMVDFAHAMLEQGMLKAVSVSFLPDRKFMTPNKDRGFTIAKAELIEASLVSVPMNPQALMIAKSLDISESDYGVFFDQNTITVNRDRANSIVRAKTAVLAANRTIRSKL